MTAILIVCDVLAADGSRMPTQGRFIDSADLAKYQAYGWRLPLGAPAIPQTQDQLDGFTKSPTEIDSWQWDWGPFLTAGETITASQFFTVPGLTLSDSTITGAVTKVLCAGGTSGTKYVVTNRVAISSGRQGEQLFTVTIT
ncbi:phage fiber-tail adaptor protein [Nocardia nova]